MSRKKNAATDTTEPVEGNVTQDVAVDLANDAAEVEHVDTGERSTADIGEKAAPKSIVPSKYAGKYKDKTGNALSMFIEGQCTTEVKNEQGAVVARTFDFDKFFDLNRKNGVADAHIEPFEKAVADKVQGGNGRARMTLRNRLAAIGRKNGGKLVDLDGTQHTIDIPEPPRSGAAKAAAEKAETEKQAA